MSTLQSIVSKETFAKIQQKFSELSKNGQIQFELIRDIVMGCKGVDAAVLDDTIKDIKNSMDKKVVNSGNILIKEDDYYKHMELIFRDQEQNKNSNDPEMEKLFKSLAVGEGDYVYKKRLSEIINTFGLSIDLNQFFRPIKDQEEINFNEFCTLFRSESIDDKARSTFYSFLDGNANKNIEEEEKQNLISIRQANFPIKYVAH